MVHWGYTPLFKHCNVCVRNSVATSGWLLSQPQRQIIASIPTDLSATAVIIPVSTGSWVSGWLVKGKPKRGAVLLLHGLRGNRYSMLERARFLKRQGYSILLIDLPAHGESSGSKISFGFYEAKGVNAAIKFLENELPDNNIAVIGVSLGAASLVFANPSATVKAVVLESMYPTITEAVIDRLQIRIGAVGKYFTPLLLKQLPIWVGVTAEQLKPIEKVADLKMPIFIMSGANDQHTTPAETKRLFNALALSQPKELWIVKGAAHIDLHAFTPKEYEAKVIHFFKTYL